MKKEKGRPEFEITCNNLIVVEGPDDEKTFQKLLKQWLNISDEVQVLSLCGVGNFKDDLPLIFSRASSYLIDHLVIARDADNSAISAFDSVRDVLKRSVSIEPEIKSKIILPSHPGEITCGKIKFGVWIFPDNQNPGELENLLMKSVEADPAIGCVNGYFDCLQNLSINNPNCQFPRKFVKAQTLAFMASRTEPDYRFGVCAQKGCWDFNHPVFTPLTQFLITMFGTTPSPPEPTHER